MVDKPRVRSRFRDRSIPAVARRLKMPEHELRRAAQRGEVKVFSWGGLDRISPVEEARIEALLQENATPKARAIGAAFVPEVRPSPNERALHVASNRNSRSRKYLAAAR